MIYAAKIRQLNRVRIAVMFYAAYILLAYAVGLVISDPSKVSWTAAIAIVAMFTALIATEYAVEYSFKRERRNEAQTIDLHFKRPGSDGFSGIRGQ